MLSFSFPPPPLSISSQFNPTLLLHTHPKHHHFLPPSPLLTTPTAPRPPCASGAEDGASVEALSSSSRDPKLSGINKPVVYEVIEVKPDGIMSIKNISRRHLLKSSGLQLRDIRSVDPSLWLMNSMPSLLVRDEAILLNLGSLKAIAMKERVLIFDYNRRGSKAFLKILLSRLNPKNLSGRSLMQFDLEVVEAALISRIQRLEQILMEVEPRVEALLEVLPTRLTADILEQLRLSKQTLVELGSKAGSLKQMLLELLDDPHEIRRICNMGRQCTIYRGSKEMNSHLTVEKHIAEEEEEEIEMLLDNYLQRCESCHGQAERLLDSAKEMEDSIAVNLSSRRLELSRFELLLQVGTFCAAIGALVAGIFGMNLKSYLKLPPTVVHYTIRSITLLQHELNDMYLSVICTALFLYTLVNSLCKLYVSCNFTHAVLLLPTSSPFGHMSVIFMAVFRLTQRRHFFDSFPAY